MVKFKKLTAARRKTPAEADSCREAGTKIDRQEADMALMDRAADNGNSFLTGIRFF